MIRDKIKPQTKLHKFFMEEGANKRSVQFDEDLWKEAVSILSRLHRPEYYLDLEDRLIEEIVVAMIKFPPGRAKEEILKIKEIVENDVEHDAYVTPYLTSLRMSVRGAIQAALGSIC